MVPFVEKKKEKMTLVGGCSHRIDLRATLSLT